MFDPGTALYGSELGCRRRICNLGLENWPSHWLQPNAHHVRPFEAGTPLPETFSPVTTSSAYPVGWTLLYEEVCLYAQDN